MKLNAGISKIFKKSDKKPSLSFEEKENMIIISKIDNIYNNIKEEPKYFIMIRYIFVFYFMFCYSLIWVQYTITADQKNNSYCFDRISNSFEICDYNAYCNDEFDNSIKIFILSTDPTLPDIDTKIETYRINQKYREFFIKDFAVYKKKNYNILNEYKKVVKSYLVVIQITNFENFDLLITFRQYCARINNLVIFVLGLFFGITVSAFTVGFVSDVLGRKKVLIFSAFVAGVASILLSTLTISLLQAPNFNNKPYNELKNQYHKMLNLDEFRIDEVYMNKFEEIVKEVYSNKAIRSASKDFFVLFYGLQGVIMFAISGSINIALSFLLENSINESYIFLNYFLFILSNPLGYFLQYIITTKSNNFYYLYIIIGICFILLGFFTIFFLYESPRYNFEFGEYNEITKLFRKEVKTSEIDHLYIKLDNQSQVLHYNKLHVNELKLGNKNKIYNIFKLIFSRLCCYGHQKQKQKIQMDLIDKDYCVIKKEDMIMNPLVLWATVFSIKSISNNYVMIICFVVNVSTLYSIVMNGLMKPYLINRADIYLSTYIVNSWQFIITCTIVISDVIYYGILKFFGHEYILFISFSMCCIFAFLNELLNVYFYYPEDLNDNINSVSNFNKTNGDALKITTIIVFFFSNGLYFIMFFYLIKFTKTAYRCFFLGLFMFFHYFSLLFGNLIVLYFDKSFFYVAILSALGFVNTYFMYTDFEFSIISDYRKLDVNRNDE